MITSSLIFFASYILGVFQIKGISDSEYQNDTNGKLLKYKNLKTKIKLIKDECGDLCDMSPSKYNSVSKDSKFYYVPIEKEVNCNRLWNTSIFDEKNELKEAIQIIPKYLRDYFSHNNMVDIKLDYYDELKDNIWNETFNKWGTNIGCEFLQY